MPTAAHQVPQLPEGVLRIWAQTGGRTVSAHSDVFNSALVFVKPN